jgi:hypothetical protein
MSDDNIWGAVVERAHTNLLADVSEILAFTFPVYAVDLYGIRCIRDCPHYGIANRRCRPAPAG